MLKKTVYFRTQDDLDKFNAISNKAEWLHNHLNGDLINWVKPQAFKTKAKLQTFTGSDGSIVRAIGEFPDGTIGIKADPRGMCDHFQLKGQCLVKGCRHGSS